MGHKISSIYSNFYVIYSFVKKMREIKLNDIVLSYIID